MDKDNPIFKAIKFVLVAVFLGLLFYFWTYLKYLVIQERLIYAIIIMVILYVAINYIEKEIDKRLLKGNIKEIILKNNLIESLKDKYDVFLAYYSGGGERYAHHIWKKLPDHKFTAFLSIEDISKSVNNNSEDYRRIINNAILKSQYFVLIMTYGFNTRPEIIRELELARKNNIERIFFKHNKLSNSELKVKLSDGVLDISAGEYISFENEADIFNELCIKLDDVKETSIITYGISKNEIMEKILRPLYSEIEIIVRGVSELTGHSIKKWDNIGLNERYLWSKFDDESLKKKIELFYSTMMKRKDDLSIYESLSKHIINTNVKEFTNSKGLEYSNSRDMVLLEVRINITYVNKRVGQGNLTLFQDLVYKKLTESIKRVNQIESFSITNRFIHLSGGKPYEPSQDEFNKLWEKIIMDSDIDPTIVFLRSSVNQIKTLGKEILQIIAHY